MPDKTPQGLVELAGLLTCCFPPGSWVHLNGVRFQPRSVSGFLRHCLNSCLPYPSRPHDRSPSGLPGFSDVSLPACHGLWTPADLHTLAIPGASVLPSVHVKTLGIRNMLISKLYQLFRVRDHPCSLQDSLSTLSPSCSQSLDCSAMDPRLDTGGWLTLSRQGLSPRKIRRASPGAITPMLSGSKKQSDEERGGSLFDVCWSYLLADLSTNRP
jgi:hypothetical protein